MNNQSAPSTAISEDQDGERDRDGLQIADTTAFINNNNDPSGDIDMNSRAQSLLQLKKLLPSHLSLVSLVCQPLMYLHLVPLLLPPLLTRHPPPLHSHKSNVMKKSFRTLFALLHILTTPPQL